MLRKLTAGNPIQKDRLDNADRLVKARLAVLLENIELRKAGKLDDPLRGQRVDMGRRMMNECGAALNVFEEEERGLLAKRSGAVRNQALRTRWVLGLGSSSLLMLLIIAGTVIERDTLNRERSQQALGESEEQFRTLANSNPQLCW